jgi:hypothetical protein
VSIPFVLAGSVTARKSPLICLAVGERVKVKGELRIEILTY